MPNINLMPPPAFEKSLVPAFQTNFNRIRDAFSRTANRIALNWTEIPGGWPNSVVVNVPFKADILINWSATCFATTVGLQGLVMTVDGGGALNGWARMFFNNTNVHAYLATSTMAYGIVAGNHTFTVQNAPVGPTTSSDNNDAAHVGFTMMETVT